MPINITVTASTDDTIKFRISGINVAMANALRRIMIADVPTLAIENVEISKNTTIIPDEMIAHRLGLIPLTSAAQDMETAEITLNVVCTGEGTSIITSDELQSSDPHVVPAVKEITIVKGSKGHELQLRGIAQWGIGRDHAKWSPVSTCFYVKKLIKNKDLFDFTVESVGQLSPTEIVTRAIQVALNQASDL